MIAQSHGHKIIICHAVQSTRHGIIGSRADKINSSKGTCGSNRQGWRKKEERRRFIVILNFYLVSRYQFC